MTPTWSLPIPNIVKYSSKYFALHKINTFQFYARRCCEFQVTDSVYYMIYVSASVTHLQRGVEIRIKAVSHANRIRAVRVGRRSPTIQTPYTDTLLPQIANYNFLVQGCRALCNDNNKNINWITFGGSTCKNTSWAERERGDKSQLDLAYVAKICISFSLGLSKRNKLNDTL